MAADFDRIRKDFPILATSFAGKPLTYLDSAATSQKPAQVIDAITNYYRRYNANIHRGVYRISEEATSVYTHSKELVAGLINAGSYRNIIYNRNTTEGINVVALTYGEQQVKKGDHILISEMEHHSNIVPWQLLAKRKGAILDYIRLKGAAHLDMEDLKRKLELEPKMVAVTHVSNVLGTINDVKEVTRLAHKAGAAVLVDAAQSVPHMPVDVKDIGCDFMAFSGHKMLGPAGVGILYGKEDILEKTEPIIGGGDMIRSVEFQKATWNDLPWKFEAGTPNIEGAVGLGAAVEYLNSVGMRNIRQHELKLTKYAMERLAKLKDVRVYGPGLKDAEKRGGVIAFNIDAVHPHDVSQIFDSENICIRAGHHCAMPLVTGVLGEGAVDRMSFYLYNNEADVDRAIAAIDRVKKVLRLGKAKRRESV